jgi:methylmalonyl-CoA mutase
MEKLFSDFPGITTAEWEEKIRADLKDHDAIQSLTRKIEEGIEIKPFYRSEDTEGLGYLDNIKGLRKKGETPNGWTVCQDFSAGHHTDTVRQNIIDALKRGAEAIRLQLPASPGEDISSLKSLLKDIPLNNTSLLFQGNMRADAIYQLLTELAGKQGIPLSELRGCLGADPIGFMVSSGIPIASLENMPKLVEETARLSRGMRVINICGAAIQNAGSTLVEELAFALAMASDYLHNLTSKGLDPQLVQNTMQMNLSTGPDFFLEIAKLRAARILWNSLATAYGADPSDATVIIHSTTSMWNLTLYDPYVNMLRGTTEAVAAILGGADLVTVLPFDFRFGESSSFADRIARNVQLILREEAYLDRVADPASGSYYIEKLTDSFCEKSWELFQEIEAMGGFQKAFELGWIQEKVNGSKRKKLENYTSGKNKLIGTNAFPDFNEVIFKQVGQEETEADYQTSLKPLSPFNPSKPFEKIRLATENSKKHPSVFLFKYGPPAMAQARAQFSANFFACAGYRIIDPAPVSSIKEGINSAIKTKAEVIVLCSSDDLYESLAIEVYREMKDHSLVVVAGHPVKSVEKLSSAGIEHFIHIKVNLLEKLQEFNSILL